MLRIPLVAKPSQSMAITLGGQRCEIEIRQKFTGGVFLSLKANGVQIRTNAICRDRVPVVRQEYLPFVGKLAFVDTQGTNDPDYTGFGTRYQLAYIP